jgi:UDP-N-acetylglucosamine 2-epimerase (non-hydrolysing)
MPDGLPPNNAPWLLCMGTRPEIIKMAPVYRALRTAGDPVCVMHTGQDDARAWPLYRFFAMRPECEVVLTRSRNDLTHLAGELLARIGEVLDYIRPRGVLVQGDTLSALTAATAAFLARIPVGHVEAGLRSHAMYDPFPEEKTRELIARLASVHFAPTAQARANLLREGVDDASIVVTGNTVVDATRLATARLRTDRRSLVETEVAEFLAAHAGHRIGLVTAHRRESWGAGIERIAAAVARILREHPDVAVVWPVHANPTIAQAVAAGMAGLDPLSASRLLLTAPIEYPTLIATLQASWIVLTDSGGIQEEAVAMGVPTLVLRATTERPEILAAGYGRLVGTAVDSIATAFDALTLDRAAHAAMRCPLGASPFGDGGAGERISSALLQTA